MSAAAGFDFKNVEEVIAGHGKALAEVIATLRVPSIGGDPFLRGRLPVPASARRLSSKLFLQLPFQSISVSRREIFP